MTTLHESEVWLRAWCACVSAFNTPDARTAENWADTCVEAYKKRFTNGYVTLSCKQCGGTAWYKSDEGFVCNRCGLVEEKKV